jgi:hypothetical protein
MAGWLAGQETAMTQKTVVHAVAWTVSETMTPGQLERFKEETANAVGKFPGVRRGWVGKLRTPIMVGDLRRDYGIIIEFENVPALGL